MAGCLDQGPESFVGDQPAQGEDDVLARVFGPEGDDVPAVVHNRSDADRDAGNLVLGPFQVWRFPDIDGRRADDAFRAVDQPGLQGLVEEQQEFLGQNVAVPMENYASFVTTQPESQRGHRVRMVDVDDVVLRRMLAQPSDHDRRDDRSGFFRNSSDADHPAVRSQADLITVRCLPGYVYVLRFDRFVREDSAEHVTGDTSFGQADGEVPHDLLYASVNRVELT